MEQLIASLADYGVLGLIAAVMIWQNNRITNRLFEVIERNTEVLTRLTQIIESKVERRSEP